MSYKITARVPKRTKNELGKAAEDIGVSESDLLRIAVNVFLPQFQSGKLDVRKYLKKAA